MKRTLLLLIATFSATLFAAEKPSLLLIGNKSEDTVSFIDLATFKEVGKATTGRGPHEVVVTPDGKKAFVSNYEGAGDSISVIDVPARKEKIRIPLGENRAPHGLELNRDGSKLYATCERSETVVEIDVASEKVTRAFKTGQQGTHMLVLSRDNKKIYTANMGS
ncbi:MAG: YncE family protein, partial [Verrucomicrobiota bacterium]